MLSSVLRKEDASGRLTAHAVAVLLYPVRVADVYDNQTTHVDPSEERCNNWGHPGGTEVPVPISQPRLAAAN